MTAVRGQGTSVPNARVVLFASGDLACNLYWQSLTFVLLFFYTERLGLDAAVAGSVLLAGAVWDGIAVLTVGFCLKWVADYRWCMLAGAAPLGLSFVLLYSYPPASGAALIALVVAAQLSFRTLYAIVNVPFAALSAVISRDSATRSRIAACRMVFGTASVIAVALATREWSLTASGVLANERSFQVIALGFALVGTVVLIVSARAVPKARSMASAKAPASEPHPAGALLRNRAFVTLNLAAACTVVAAAVLNGSVLYYFTYVEHDAAAGTSAMAWMGIAGAVAIPAWMALRHRIGTRGLWFVDGLWSLATVGLYAVLGRGIFATEAFLFAMQVAMIGFAFAFWSMLPDTVEWGEHAHGARLEGLIFGAAALGQKLALGTANALLGLLLSVAGYHAGHPSHEPGALAAGLRLIMLAVPASAIALSVGVMLLNPLRRDTHAALLAAIDARSG